MLIGNRRGFTLGVVSALVTLATSLAVRPVRAAGGRPDPTLLLAEVIVSGGDTSFIRGFEGLGDVTLARWGGFREGAGLPRGQVRLFRGFSRNRDWWDWRQQVLQGHAQSARRDVSVVLVDETGTEVARWELKAAWPLSVKVSLGADGVAQEELVLAHGAITLVNPPPVP